MISRDNILELYHAILLREPEGEHIFDWWQSMGINYNQVRAALISSEEFRILQEREQSLRNRGIIDRNSFEKKFAKYFQAPLDAGLPDLLKNLLRAYCDDVKPDLVIALGGLRSKSCIDYITSYTNGYTKCISNIAGVGCGNSVNIPMAGKSLLNFLESEDFTFTLGIVESDENPDIILSMYKNLPEAGLLICVGDLSQDLYNKINEAKSVVWGEILKFEGYTIVSRYVWPFKINMPAEPDQIIKKGSVKIAIACIVKNEALFIEEFIRSNSKFSSHITIMDTGSTDETIKLAIETLNQLDIPYNLEQIDFKNFAHARNSAISAVPENIDWILMLDADEKLSPYNMQKLIDLVEDSTVDAYALPRYNPLDSNPDPKFGRYPDRQARLFRAGTKTNAHYIGAVHEALIIEGIMEFPPINTQSLGGDLGGPHIFHSGSVIDKDKFMEKSKFYEDLSKIL